MCLSLVFSLTHSFLLCLSDFQSQCLDHAYGNTQPYLDTAGTATGFRRTSPTAMIAIGGTACYRIIDNMTARSSARPRVLTLGRRSARHRERRSDRGRGQQGASRVVGYALAAQCVFWFGLVLILALHPVLKRSASFSSGNWSPN